jgi:hypothetical protein
MKQSRRSFFSILAGALALGVPGLALARKREHKLALVCHRLAWEDRLTGLPYRGQFKSIADARKAGFADADIVMPPSHIEPPEGVHDFPR